MNPFVNSGGPIDHLVQQQGWSRETLGELACQFIADRKQSTKFLFFLEEVAKEENAGAKGIDG